MLSNAKRKNTSMFADGYSERRKFSRFPISIPLVYSRSGVKETTNCNTSNISANGLSFITPEEIEVSSLLNIRLRIPDNNQEIPLEAEVVWLKILGPGQYKYGLKIKNTAIKAISLVLRTILSRL